MLDSVYIRVILIGILHGLELGHGWPVALLYSMRTDKPMYYGFVTSGLISFFHFVSSIAVVAAYILLSGFINISSYLMRYIGAAMLIVLAYRFYREDAKNEFEAQHGHLHGNREEITHIHEHEHPGQGRHVH